MNKGDHWFWSPLPASRPRAGGVHLLIEGMTDRHSQHCRLAGCDTTSLCLWKPKPFGPPIRAAGMAFWSSSVAKDRFAMDEQALKL
ncbi:hypothetical protein ELI13_36680 [Rhizobium ruizarguesonis]|uniref:Uncharacterized protein n=2 Tax=Rhizobium ruizarguesonis TaxID=2081791 RepID=A0ABY1X5D4_9HYPH|nr:hypothetical protein ELI48_31085 [Rhizobium ruizarguesonis]TAU57567.1 hypothetical protein ELI45_35875 [Rhizobium ruizarguesonis]TAU59386.1 hypothetical protein ELI46_38095 [Rhizobium ruizarguesonis]TAV03578.1 hypothetical protein ELI34_28590 [Rhizobium ruizarguesonis]TAV19681.1 hypothetical protein ELI36_35965 [Rhizobium ruizarguesonis]